MARSADGHQRRLGRLVGFVATAAVAGQGVGSAGATPPLTSRDGGSARGTHVQTAPHGPVGGIATPKRRSGPPNAAFTPAYADEFSGTRLRLDDWYYRILKARRANGYNTVENVSVSDGALNLRYTREDVTGDGLPDYVGAGILSRRQFGYGYYEVRAKLSAEAKGLHTSFWGMGLRRGFSSQGIDPRIDQDMDAGRIPEFNEILEIDGFEHDSPDAMDPGTIAHQQGRVKDRLGWQSGADLGIDFADWNVYGYEYRPGGVDFYVNGVLIFTSAIAESRNLFSPMSLWLTALPYPRGVAGIDDSKFPGFSHFDYFRYYSKSYPGANRLGNGSFDHQGNAKVTDQVVPGWIESRGRANARIVTDERHDGSKSMIHSGDAAYLAITRQHLTHLPNGRYALRAWVKSSGGQARAEIRVRDHGGAVRTVKLPTSDQWRQVTIDDIRVTSNAASIELVSQADAGQWARFDAVTFAETQ